MKDILFPVGITVLIAVSIFGLVFVILPDSSLDDKTTFVIIDSGNLNGNYFEIYEDITTGVQYVFIDSGYGGGLSPRYNLDGMIYVNKSLGGLA